MPTSQKPSHCLPPPLVPIHTCTSSSASMHGTAYRGGNHLARRLPPPPGCWQSPPHIATSACRLSPSTFSTLLAVDPAPLGWGICRTFNHPAEIIVNSFLFELIWGFSFIHRMYSAPTLQDLVTAARDSISSYQITWGRARYVQSHPKSVGMAYFPEHILNIATFG